MDIVVLVGIALTLAAAAVMVVGSVVRRLGPPVPLLVARRRLVGGQRTRLSGWGAWADVAWVVLGLGVALIVVGAVG